MTTPGLDHLAGEWTGTNRLYFEGKTYDSQSTASFGRISQGQFILMAYTWRLEDAPQDGQAIFPSEMGETASKAVWFDSWHMAKDIAICEATMRDGTVYLLSSFAAPPGPDWGWRIEIEGGEGDSLVMRMYIIMPGGGPEQIAVLAEYQRASPAA